MRSVLALLLCCAAPLAAQDTLKIPPSQQPAPPDTAPAAQAPPRERAGGIRIPLEELSRIRIRPRSEAAVAVPELGGLTPADARAALARAGLVAGEVDELPVAGRPAGTVVMQRPAAGTRVPRGSAVGMMLAAAPAMAAAPADPPPAAPAAPVQERPVAPQPVPVPRTPPVASAREPVVAPPPEPIAVLPVEPADLTEAAAEASPPAEAPAEPGPAAVPAVPVIQPQPPTAQASDAAAPAPARATLRWLPWLLAALVVLAAAATVRRMRARAVPTTVHARTRHGAEAARVALRGAPFGDARMRMRVRTAGAEATSTSPFALR